MTRLFFDDHGDDDAHMARRAPLAWVALSTHRRRPHAPAARRGLGLRRLRSVSREPARREPRADHGARALAAKWAPADRARRWRNGAHRRSERSRVGTTAADARAS